MATKIIPTLTQKDLTRFWKKVDIRGAGDCWLWTAGTFESDYGLIRVRDLLLRAHRVAYAMIHGQPGDLFVCHSCDVKQCVNPGHLWLGTPLDNMVGMKRKGRKAMILGEDCGSSKLTEADVREIFRLQGTMSQRQIGERFGVAQSAISKIHRRIRWGHVSDLPNRKV